MNRNSRIQLLFDFALLIFLLGLLQCSGGDINGPSNPKWKSGILRQQTYDSNNKPTWYWVYHYSISGDIEKVETFDLQDRLDSYNTYEIGSEGIVVRENRFTLSGFALGHRDYVYDSSLQLTSDSVFDTSNTLQSFGVYKIVDGRVISTTGYTRAHAKLYERYFEYGPDGLRTKSVDSAGIAALSHTEYGYKDGLLDNCLFYDSTGAVVGRRTFIVERGRSRRDYMEYGFW
jgi:hypothetical protein